MELIWSLVALDQLKVRSHNADVIPSPKLLELLAGSPPVNGKLMNFAHGLAFQVDQMRARLAFWLERDRIYVLWINSSILPDRCGINYGHVQINTATTTSLADHLDSIHQYFCFGKITRSLRFFSSLAVQARQMRQQQRRRGRLILSHCFATAPQQQRLK